MACAGITPYRLEALALVFWLLKDASWALLVAPLAWLAAASAIVSDSYVLVGSWRTLSSALLAHSFAMLAWLIGNTVWMTGEFLFDSPKPGRVMPWNEGPLLEESKSSLNAWLWTAFAILTVGLLQLLFFYSSYVPDSLGEQQGLLSAGARTSSESLTGKQQLVFGIITPEVYQVCFIGPWILKDLCWILQEPWPGLVFSIIVGTIMLDCFWRYRTLRFVALLFWVGGNTVWAGAELVGHDEHLWTRIVAAIILGVGACVAVADFIIRVQDDAEV